MNSPREKLVMVTCYDATFAKICASVEGIDYVLVGDSLGMVIAGDTSTQNVSMDQMLYHIRAVARGLKNSRNLPLIGDMPIHSYDNTEIAVTNAGKMIEAGCSMVKVEGPVLEVVSGLRAADIPVCGHIGLTPQSIQDYKLQGKTDSEAARLMKEAAELQQAGCGLLVLEMIPALLAEQITKSLLIPTIGIGAGPHCSGQVLVLYDLLGLNPDFAPKFLKKFSNGFDWVQAALKTYSSEVKSGEYPSVEYSFTSKTSDEE